jgi:hypothetical protein
MRPPTSLSKCPPLQCVEHARRTRWLGQLEALCTTQVAGMRSTEAELELPGGLLLQSFVELRTEPLIVPACNVDAGSWQQEKVAPSSGGQYEPSFPFPRSRNGNSQDDDMSMAGGTSPRTSRLSMVGTKSRSTWRGWDAFRSRPVDGKDLACGHYVRFSSMQDLWLLRGGALAVSAPTVLNLQVLC